MTPDNGNTEEQSPRDLYPVNVAAHRLGITPRKLWSVIAQGRIRTKKLDGRRLIPADALEEFINGLPEETHPSGPGGTGPAGGGGTGPGRDIEDAA